MFISRALSNTLVLCLLLETGLGHFMQHKHVKHDLTQTGVEAGSEEEPKLVPRATAIPHPDLVYPPPAMEERYKFVEYGTYTIADQQGGGLYVTDVDDKTEVIVIDGEPAQRRLNAAGLPDGRARAVLHLTDPNNKTLVRQFFAAVTAQKIDISDVAIMTLDQKSLKKATKSFAFQELENFEAARGNAGKTKMYVRKPGRNIMVKVDYDAGIKYSLV